LSLYYMSEDAHGPLVSEQEHIRFLLSITLVIHKVLFFHQKTLEEKYP